MSNINRNKVMEVSKSLPKYVGNNVFFLVRHYFAMENECIVGVMPLIKPDFCVESFAHG